MTNLEIKIDEETKQVLRDLEAIINRLGVSMLLIGAKARLIIFDFQYNIEGRVTTDCDVAVKLDNWDCYNRLVTEMTVGQEVKFQKTSIIHRFIHSQTSLELDMIPFGNISDEKGESTWPDGNQMSVLGLEEAFSKTQIYKIDNFAIPIVNIPIFVALKLLAWSERKANKDLEDILFILQNYQDPERIYEEEVIDEVLSDQFDFDEATGILIGRDIKKVFQKNTLEKLKEINEGILAKRNQYFPQFIPKNLDQENWDQAFEKVVKRFEALQYGLQSR